MPISPGGDGSGTQSGDSPQSWTAIPCPGHCPAWPSDYIYLKIPGGTSYVCGSDPPVTITATTTYLQLHIDTQPEWVEGSTCRGRGWSGVSTITPDPVFYEGVATIRVFICCNNENLGFPAMWFYYENHIRLIGDPDPNIYACIENACMTTLRCECTGTEDPRLPGYCRGTATLPNTDLPLYYGACACNIAVVGGSEEFEIKAFGHGACDCTGIPYGPIPVTLECANLVPPPAYVQVAAGSITYQEEDSVVFPSLTGPHWEGEMNSSLGDGCTWNVGMFYNPVTSSLGYIFEGPVGVGCTVFCSPFSTPSSASGTCDPFYLQVVFDGGVAILTIG